MVFLYILLALFVIIFAVSLLPISAEIEFREGLEVTVKIAEIRVYSYPPAMKKILKKEKKKSEKIQKPKEEKSNKKDLLKNLNDILAFAFKSIKRVGRMLSHLKLKKLDFYLTVSSDDAFNTSIYYGELCSVVYPLNALICSAVDRKKVNMSVSANYDVINPELKFYFSASIRIFFAVVAAIMILSDFLKSGILKGENKNERK